MASVFIREGKKGKQIGYEYSTPENPRKRVVSGIYLTGSKAHQRNLLSEAQLKAQALEDEAMRDVGRAVAKKNHKKKETPTIVEYVQNAQVGQADSTKKSINCFKEEFIEWLTFNNLHNLPFDKLTKEHAFDYYSFLAQNMKLSSAKTYYAWIKVIYNIAVDDELISENPLNLTRKRLMRINKIADKEIAAKAFRIEDIRKLLAYEDQLIADSTLLTFLCNGRRLNEIFKLKWSDIDWEERKITFKTSKTGMGCYVYIGPKLEALLKRIRETHKGPYVLPRKVMTLQGEIHTLTTDMLSRRMRYACVGIGLLKKSDKGYSGYGHHSIRRTVETLLIEHLDFVRADALVGHAPTTLGAKHYYKPTDELYKSASMILESMIS